MDIEKVQSSVSLLEAIRGHNQANPQRRSKFRPSEKQAQPD
jgi:hypothetical protein